MPDQPKVKTEIREIFRASVAKQLARSLFSTRVAAGFPSPAEDYIEGRIDLNKELIKHPAATFYMRVTGDSMIDAGILPNALIIVDVMEEARDGHIIVARLNNDLCIKKFSLSESGAICLKPANDLYEPIEVCPDDDFQVWGRVMHAVTSF